MLLFRQCGVPTRYRCCSWAPGLRTVRRNCRNQLRCCCPGCLNLPSMRNANNLVPGMLSMSHTICDDSSGATVGLTNFTIWFDIRFTQFDTCCNSRCTGLMSLYHTSRPSRCKPCRPYCSVVRGRFVTAQESVCHVYPSNMQPTKPSKSNMK